MRMGLAGSFMAVVAGAGGCVDESAGPVECGPGTKLDLTGERCIPDDELPPRLVCGTGTRELDGACVVDDRRRFELRTRSKDISADRLSQVPILALGTNADGTLVNEPAILSIDRPGAGAFPLPRIELGAMGALAHYRPCSSTQAGCLGPVRFSLALLSDPGTAVATLDANLVAEASGSAAAACMSADENVMFFDGDDEIYAGTLAVVDAGWGVNARRDRLNLRVEPNVPTQGRFWRFEFSTVALGTDLVPGVYEGARRPQGGGNGPMRPGLDINGPQGQCVEVNGSFEVHTFEMVDDELSRALISFEQRCAGAPRALRGCIRLGQ